MKKHYLLTPGPTPVPDEIMKAMALPIIHHRTGEYMDFVKSVNKNLKSVFKTRNNVLMFTASGTGAMEASLVNTLSEGDTAIVVNGGKFGERFEKICQAFRIKTIPVSVPWGERLDPKQVENALRANPGAKAVLVQLCETSTATLFDIKALGDIVKKTSAILVVDVISGLGADDFDMDNWNVDIAIGGSQKGFMIPPGLSFSAVSQKAWSMVKTSKLPKFYFDFNKYEKCIKDADSPFTPAITLVIGLNKALSTIVEEGVDNFIERHKRDAQFVRKYVTDLGLEVYSRSPSDAVTAVNVPKDIDGSKLVKSLKSKGVTFAGGQDQLKGKIFRIAHMGGITRKDLEEALGILKETLKEDSVKAEIK